MGKHISKDDQIRLIQECRNSGLSDYQWCSLNGISHSTFYRWVTKLRTETCTPVPSKVIPVSEKQEVVKLEIMEELPVIKSSADGEMLKPLFWLLYIKGRRSLQVKGAMCTETE